MESTRKAIKFCTPAVEELTPYHEVKCKQPNCGSTFTNMGNYDMHLIKHHKIGRSKSDSLCLYHCPSQNCAYNLLHHKAKHFKNIKYLRQHYQKVHLQRDHICNRCLKGFATVGRLVSHKQKECGQKFICYQCGWEYSTAEALHTHGKRKKHNIKEPKRCGKATYETSEPLPVPVMENSAFGPALAQLARVQSKLTPIPTVMSTEQSRHQETQTEPAESEAQKCLCAASVQTTFLPTLNDPSFKDFAKSFSHTNSLAEAGTSPLRHSETQTDADFLANVFPNDKPLIDELTIIHNLSLNVQTQTEAGAPLSAETNLLYHQDADSFFKNEATKTMLQDSLMLTQPSHMHTQTCDDFLSELGLADIQTQTNWSSLNGPEDKHAYSSTATSTNFNYDDLLVSTETQTNFSQCLFNACNCSDVDDNLYTTQYTQTCDELLDGLFNSQDADLIGGFQSTYTQT